MKASKIIDFLEQLFPLELQMSFDNCGLQVGNVDNDIHKVLVSLNMDESVIDKAIESKCNMIITHHPLLIQPIKQFNVNHSTVRIIEKALKHNVLIYSLHTCLDKGKNDISMNDWLIRQFDCDQIENYDEIGIGKKAILNEPQSLGDFLIHVKNIFSLDQIKYCGNIKKEIKTFAICGGSASEDIYRLANQVDAYISGDSKYHQGQFCVENDIVLIDVGHHIEIIFETKMIELIRHLDIEIESAHCKDYFKFI